jgi:hypothetical protein
LIADLVDTRKIEPIEAALRVGEALGALAANFEPAARLRLQAVIEVVEERAEQSPPGQRIGYAHTILINMLVPLLIGALAHWPYSAGWGWGY